MLSKLLDARRIAVVGIAKNSGKTTTLNYLIQMGEAQKRTVGLMSVGT